jgi:hypothetical protein
VLVAGSRGIFRQACYLYLFVGHWWPTLATDKPYISILQVLLIIDSNIVYMITVSCHLIPYFAIGTKFL